MDPAVCCYPLQCNKCGRELVNMGCKVCSPPPVAKNSGGHPMYGQLSVTTSVHCSPGKRYNSPKLIDHITFKAKGGRSLRLLDGLPLTQSILRGENQPVSRRFNEGRTFSVRTEFKWGGHEWESFDVPYERDTITATTFSTICTHFRYFIKAMEKCSDSNKCLCGGPGSLVTEENVYILGYNLWFEEAFVVIKVEASLTPHPS